MAKAKRSAAQKAATKRMLAAAAARRAGGTSPAKRKKAKKPAKGLSKSKAASLGHAASGYQLKKVSKGASDAARLSALEHNQNVIVHGISAVASELKVHRAALVGAGLLTMRGKAG